MDSNKIIQDAKSKLTAAGEHFRSELGKIRTGRAHPGMLDGVSVTAYGQTMPLKAVATITTPEPTLLQITPFDAANLQAISSAIRDEQSLGLNPADDGRVVRIQIPPLNTETRQQMTKVVGQKLEESLISARNARHEAIHTAEGLEKSKAISQDELDRTKKQIDELLSSYKSEAESLAKAKESEIMTV